MMQSIHKNYAHIPYSPVRVVLARNGQIFVSFARRAIRLRTMPHHREARDSIWGSVVESVFFRPEVPTFLWPKAAY